MMDSEPPFDPAVLEKVGPPLNSKLEKRSEWNWQYHVPEEVEAKWPTLSEESKWVAEQCARATLSLFESTLQED
jgi:hypothetical protein